MKELEDLKELYKDEIKRIAKKDTLTPADDEAAKKAMDGYEKAEMLCKKLAMEEVEYSGRPHSMMNPVYSQNGYSNRMPEMTGGYAYCGDEYSERRGRNMRNGQYISRSPYSTHEDSVRYTLDKLEDMRMEATDDRTRRAIDMCIDEINRR